MKITDFYENTADKVRVKLAELGKETIKLNNTEMTVLKTIVGNSRNIVVINTHSDGKPINVQRFKAAISLVKKGILVQTRQFPTTMSNDVVIDAVVYTWSA